MARSDLTEEAYRAASRAAANIVRGIVNSIEEGIRLGEVTSEEDLSDRIHEECDNALIYTADQYACVWGLPDTEDAIEEGLSSPSCFSDALGAQAYCNLRAEVSSHDFSDAFEVARDAAEEKGLCSTCLNPHHDTCSNDSECRCCTDSQRGDS